MQLQTYKSNPKANLLITALNMITKLTSYLKNLPLRCQHNYKKTKLSNVNSTPKRKHCFKTISTLFIFHKK